jgi:hypothetical protein
MLIDAFADDWIDVLEARATALTPSSHLYLLLDGAFVPGLHNVLAHTRKLFLFSALPGCTDEARDVSPFLTEFRRGDKFSRVSLKRCDRWPMVSVIETPEVFEELAQRLSAWCVVEADDQRFNFRFPDTRRLPAIFNTLDVVQRSQLTGPAARWSFIARDGRWHELDIVPSAGDVALDPKLDKPQFAALVDDSLADELMVLLGDHGHDAFLHPSASHALLSTALQAAHKATLSDENVPAWCEWFWLRGQSVDKATAITLLETWRDSNQ